MRLLHVLFKNARAPQDIRKVPLRAPRLELKLKNTVGNQFETNIDRPTLQATINVINALTKHEYNEELCQKEIVEVREAAAAAQAKFLEKKRSAKLDSIPGQKMSTYKMNKFLKKFPVPDKKYWIVTCVKMFSFIL